MAKKKGISETVAKSPNRRRKATKISLLAILSVIVIFLCVVAGYSVSFAKKTFANVYLGETYLGGKSKQQVTDTIKTKSGDFLQQKIALDYINDKSETKTYEIDPNETGLVFDVDKTVEQIYGYGRDGNILNNFSNQFVSLFKPRKFIAVYTINEEALTKKIKDIADQVDVPEQDYEIEYAGGGKFKLLNDRQTGKRIEQQVIIDHVKNQISRLKINKFSFESKVYEPRVTAENAQAKLTAANNILRGGELKLVYSELSFSLDADTIGGIIKSRPKGDDLELYADSDKTKTQVVAIAESVYRQPKNAVLQATGGTVSAFQLSQEGRELDQTQTVIDIGNALLARAVEGVTKVDTVTVALNVKVTQPEISSATLDQYGLKELVATGTTDFRKSPANRVHNITIGANAINGTLIKPGEEFSTLGRLGKIEASTGYLPELVIKNNKTLPDYGGGLCQVSTTLFRAALNAGMKITSRSNHSYRVSYYEPPVGMDATIFDPAPDFKFINNYSSHILVQSKIEGTKITFEFYGTKDSRQVTIAEPVVTDIVEPPAPVETIDPSLPAGTRNLISHSHQGATAKFHYEVVKDGETLQKTDYTSKYVALPEQWTVAAPVVTDPAATSAPEAAPTG